MGADFSHAPLAADALRWRCSADSFAFETTTDLEPRDEIVGQDEAIEALRFGLETDAPGQHIFVRGLVGTGRSTTVRRLLSSIGPPGAETPDLCFVHNFEHPERPRLLVLPRGRGEAFGRAMERLVVFVSEGLAQGLASDLVKSRIGALEKAAAAEIQALATPFEKELEQAGLALMVAQVGPVARQVIVPVIGGQPAPPERLEALRREGTVSNAQLEALRERIGTYAERLGAIGESINEIQNRKGEAIDTLVHEEARSLLSALIGGIERAFPIPEVASFLAELVDDLVSKRLHHLDQAEQFCELYRVNVVLCHGDDEPRPIVVDNAPTLPGLLGSVDWSMSPDGERRAPHMLIRAGSLLRANGGYLILEARDVLEEPGAWKSLIRTLRTGRIELTPPDLPVPWRVPMLRPDPIPVEVKVVLLGDPGIYPMLEVLDPDFSNLFKVLADFDTVIPRNPEGLQAYAGVVARIARDEGLPGFDRTAVAALCEHGARIAAQRDKLTARFGRLADMAREAAFVAGKRNAASVAREDVEEAVRRNKRRAALPSRHFAELIADGTVRIATRGTAVGQINGLAVMHAGPLSYGFPTRITATIGPGTAGAINIEREAELSGAIHTKGFYILGGLLRNLLRTEHPLAFDASVAFEQIYGGIDGDSASAAEICCLLSALTDVPLRLDLAMTGAIDQVGNVLPVGAVNEKIEGFFDACAASEPTGTQGVLIPSANAGDLMLREDVVEACAQGRFAVHAVDSIHQALGLFTGLTPGERDSQGAYPADSLLGLAVGQARRYWEMVSGGAARGDGT
jgi:predicted ATP-dependent protease